VQTYGFLVKGGNETTPIVERDPEVFSNQSTHVLLRVDEKITKFEVFEFYLFFLVCYCENYNVEALL